MATKTKAEAGTSEIVTRSVTLDGIVPIMFDRYPGDNDTKLETAQKLYLDEIRTICLPSINVMSFLSAENTMSAPIRLLGKKARGVCRACLAFVVIEPMLIPIQRDGKPILFGKFDGDKDPVSGCFIHRAVARLPKGIPNPKVRPTLPTPWSIDFRLSILPNNEIQEVQIKNLFSLGGMSLGLGTFRGMFGKFRVVKWE